MSKIVSIHSFRGGTGKSNVTANLGVTIARAGYRVGIVDTDIQSPGIHVVFHLNEDRVTRCLNDFLWGDCAIEEAAYDVTDAAIGNVADGDDRPRVFLVPASIKTNEIGRVLKEGYDVGLLNDGFKRLIQKLDLDFLLIDTHPGVNEETLLSIVISDHLLLVLRPDQQDFQGSLVTLELARRLDVNAVSLIVNKIPPGMDRAQLKTKVESIYSTDVLALLPLNFELVRMASNGLFVNRYPEHPFTRELRLVANSLTK
ncbi:MinD/ParA/CobQ/CobA-like protein [Bremerella volcania]|uniref:MinD/ParA/CobQ/CobA-like protein n=1 Tax=Bremerella volcania TaxID=2527984 RepID=A0A518C6T6_9BACT|nr:MinD/ParA family protein [Bremerella volcania]QDU74930.1 MinD/ParA/CobQ/CobA-like protein [Bremerella volcania]